MSAVWNYFQKLSKNTAQCNLCSKYLKSSGNTSNLNKHLKYCRTNIDKEVVLKPLKRQSESKLTSTAKQLKADNVEFVQMEEDVKPNSNTIWNAESCENSLATMHVPFILENSTIQQYQWQNEEPEDNEEEEREVAIETASSNKTENSSGKAAVTNAILYFICADCRPCSTIQSKGFLKLIQTLVPHYEVPAVSRMKELLTEKYIDLRNSLREKMKAQHEFCVTCDIWTETATTTLHADITLHYLEGVKRRSAYIATVPLCKQNLPQNINEKLLNELKQWHVRKDNVVAVVTEASAVKTLFKGTNAHIPCFGFILSRIVDKMFAEEDIVELVDKIRAIVKYIVKDALYSDQQHKVQCTTYTSGIENKKLKLDAKSCWVSTNDMLESFIELSSFISLQLQTDSLAPPMLTANELNDLNGLMLLLKPFRYVAQQMCGKNYVPISEVIPLVNCLKSQLESVQFQSTLCQEARKVLLEQLHKRCDSFENITLMALSTLLDPRFKNLHFKNEKSINRAISFLHTTASECKPAHNSFPVSDGNNTKPEYDFWRAHNELVLNKRMKANTNLHDELSLYLRTAPLSIESNPIDIWEGLRETLPGLYRQFRRHAVIVGTSVPAERLFSEAGANAAEQRKLFKPERFSELQFIAGRLEEWFED